MAASRAPTMNDVGARDRLFRAAIELFNRRGYAATSVREIVESAGVTKPVLYYYFGSKEGIYLALREEARKAFQTRVDEAKGNRGNVRERICRFLEGLFQLIQDNIEVVRFIHVVNYGPPQDAPPFDLDSMHHTFQAVLEELVDEGIRTGELRPGNVKAMATALHGASSGCVEIALAHPELSVDVAELHQVLEVVFEGIASQKRREKEQQK